MGDPRQVRSRILAVTCGGTFAVALYSLFSPTAGNRPLPAYHFPAAVPFAGWEAVGTEPLRDRRKGTAHRADVVLSGQSYRYVKDGVALDADIRYVAGTLGEVSRLLEDQTDVPEEAFQKGELRYDEGRGWHSLFAHGHRAHLSACIHRRSGTTVTSAQFLAHRRAHDFSRRRLVLSVLGRESLRDYRCLWVHLSTPAQEEEWPAAAQRLEAAWAEWHRPWQPRFPSY